MRVQAPFPILPVLFGLVFALSLPPTLAAMPLASRYVPTTMRRSSTPSEVRVSGRVKIRKDPRNNPHKEKLRSAAKTHKAERSSAAKATSGQKKLSPAATRKPNRSRIRGAALDRAPADRATTRRVHAWLQGEAMPRSAARLTVAAAGAPPAVSASEMSPAGMDPAKPVSVISTVRTAETTGADKPQLPPVEELVAEPVILPGLYDKRGRLQVPPPLKGSHEILVHQNLVADDEGLDRVRDDEDLARMRRSGLLVAIPAGSALRVDDRLTLDRRFCRPWTALFLDTLARQYFAQFHSALQVNSAVRTVAFQQRLIHTNGNAAPANGDTASPHLTGQAVDLAKRGLSMAEIAWLRGYLLPLVQQGKVDVEEEFQQSCFHISVYKNYMPANQRMIATTHREGMGSLATTLSPPQLP